MQTMQWVLVEKTLSWFSLTISICIAVTRRLLKVTFDLLEDAISQLTETRLWY